jgi:uncharacterized protein YeeX (DUF496 family)
MNKRINQDVLNTLIDISGNIRVSLLAASDSFSVDLISSPTVNRNGVSNVKYSIYVTGSNIDRTVIDTIRKAIDGVDKDPRIFISVSNISMVGDNYSDTEYLGYQIDVTVELRYLSYIAELKNELSKTSKESKILTYLINKLSLNELIESVVPAVQYSNERMNIDIGCGLHKTDLLFNLYQYIDKEFNIDEVKDICKTILGSAYIGLIETDALANASYLRSSISNQLKYTLLIDWSKYDAVISTSEENTVSLSIAFNDLPYVLNSKISLASDMPALSVYIVSLELSYYMPIDMVHNVLSDITDIVTQTFNVNVDEVKVDPVEVSIGMSRHITLHANIYVSK